MRFHQLNANLWLSQIFALHVLFFASPTSESMPIGVILGIGGFLLLFASACHLSPIRQDGGVQGVYRWVRHPQLVGALLLGLGMSFAALSFSSLCLLLLLFPFYASQQIKAQEQKYAAELQASYIEYKNQVPQFFPGLGLPWARRREKLEVNRVSFKELASNVYFIGIFLQVGIVYLLLLIKMH